MLEMATNQENDLQERMKKLMESPPPGTVAYYQREREALEDRLASFRDQSKEVEKLKYRIRELEHFEKAGKFYLRMQNHIKNNDNIQAAWTEFYTMYALCVPDISDLK